MTKRFILKIKRSMFAAIIAGPILALTVPVAAMAADQNSTGADPGYQAGQSSNDANGSTSTTTRSYMAPDGHMVYQRTTTRTGPNGTSTSTVGNGDSAGPAGTENGYQTSQTSYDANGSTTTTTRSYMAPDGHMVYQRTTTRTGPNGTTTSTVGNGGADSNAPSSAAAKNTPAAPANPAGIAAPTADQSGAPLVVVNTPAMPGR